jgi:putative ABC transport system substrate-binding protein
MRRRDFITLVGATVAWPHGAGAQQPAVPVVGFVRIGTPETTEIARVPFLQGLKEGGYVDGQNVRIEYRWPTNDGDQLRQAMNDLVGRPVSVIVANGNSAALAAKAIGTSIPVVFSVGSDPVAMGLVASLNRPGGTLTGVSIQQGALVGKEVELLRELVPNVGLIGYLLNPINEAAAQESAEALAVGRSLGQKILVQHVSSEPELGPAFEAMTVQGVGALMIDGDVFLNGHLGQLVALAARHKLPALQALREFAAAGGLMSYGSSLAYSYSKVGLITARILKGEKPQNLPVELAERIELVLNLKTAKALGITVPITLLGRADEVIE